MWIDPMKRSLFKRISFFFLSPKTCLRSSIQLNESFCLCFIHGLFQRFNFKMLYFGVNHVFWVFLYIPTISLPLTRSTECLFHQNAAHLALPTSLFIVTLNDSMENLKWCFLSKLNQHLSPSIFFLSSFFCNRFAILYIWDKVVVDDRRYKTSSPVCISSNSIRMRVHEHHAQKWLNACVTMDFCALHWYVSYCQRTEKKKCERERARREKCMRSFSRALTKIHTVDSVWLGCLSLF